MRKIILKLFLSHIAANKTGHDTIPAVYMHLLLKELLRVINIKSYKHKLLCLLIVFLSCELNNNE